MKIVFSSEVHNLHRSEKLFFNLVRLLRLVSLVIMFRNERKLMKYFNQTFWL